MANADCIVIEGSNMAECHPVGFQWVVEAKKRGARIIHVDPRYTRTSAFANRHIGIRGGTDVVQSLTTCWTMTCISMTTWWRTPMRR